MVLLASALLLIGCSGIPGLFCVRSHRAGELWAGLLVLAGVAMGLASIVLTLASRLPAAIDWPWEIPGGALVMQLDPLSALFLLPLFLVVGCGACYGFGYWPQSQHPRSGRKLRFFYGVISAAMICLLTARNGVLFLLAWEVMALSGFFLIVTEETKEEARRAGYIYLAATHTGTLALFGMFALLGQAVGSFAFPETGSLAVSGTAIFLLGLFGFGMKAGLMPLHIWLPGAHAAAPSHASALLSGVMIKTGIYGLVRLTSFFNIIPPWWGWLVLGIGAVSGILGVALAIAQHDIKRLLAYHSVENIGIIALGLGLALLGRSFEIPTLVLLGLSGALLHVINHGLFKSLLFLSAGSVIHATGTREIDHYGGLLRHQPWTALFFLVGAVAISGLPPFNGFVSEWLIYLASLAALHSSALTITLAVLVAPALALIGGLALACFVKVFGVTFLGEPRSSAAVHGHEAPLSMRWAMAPLLAACVFIGLLPGSIASLLGRAAADWSPLVRLPGLTGAMAPLPWIGIMGWCLLAGCGICGWWLFRRTRSCPADVSTWGCGYAFLSRRMQYTASSFADGLVGLFHFGLKTEREGGDVQGLFPAPEHFHSHTPDSVLDSGLLPLFQRVGWLCVRLRARIQNGMVAFYLAYVALTVLCLLLFVM